jgi:signal transduction histidine kinase
MLNPAKQERYLDRLQREINRLSGLIESLLRLSRLEQDRVDFEFELFDLNQLVLQYAGDRKPLVMSQELELIVQTGSDLPPIKGDAELLGQVFGIILTNATNYTPPGGTITVVTLTDHSQQQERVGFRISDTGPGIPPEDQSRVFERFFRGKVALSAGKPGTGLGLSIAQKIVERHDGTIDVHSEGIKGKGAAFTVWIPVVES